MNGRRAVLHASKAFLDPDQPCILFLCVMPGFEDTAICTPSASRASLRASPYLCAISLTSPRLLPHTAVLVFERSRGRPLPHSGRRHLAQERRVLRAGRKMAKTRISGIRRYRRHVFSPRRNGDCAYEALSCPLIGASFACLDRRGDRDV